MRSGAVVIRWKVNNFWLFFLAAILFAGQAWAADEASTVTALRLSNAITGGYMPSTDPLFTQMVSQVVSGDIKGAATTAVTSKYYANYLARRLAFQMQTPALDATVTRDNDATAFLIAHFGGAPGVTPSISTIWSENQTYFVDIPKVVSGATTVTPGHAADAATPEQLDWSQLKQMGPQQVWDWKSIRFPIQQFVAVPLPQIHVGGYATASTSRGIDGSFAKYGTALGTNLRMIEGIWEISTGLALSDFEDTKYASGNKALAAAVPRFVPEYNPNFYVGQGQPACIACHGGGLSAIPHGYATVANVFDFNLAAGNVGFAYLDPSNTDASDYKAYGSGMGSRVSTQTCDLVRFPNTVCNPDSAGVGTDFGWDLSSWEANGTLTIMGWNGPVTGKGLNQLGTAIGKANIVYEFLTKRVINELCPMALPSFSQSEIKQIAAQANPFATPKGTDDIRTIIVSLATNSKCL